MTGPQTDAAEWDGQPVYVGVLSEIARREDRDVLSLPPLGETVDVDALCRLVDSLEEGRVSLRYSGYDITVHADRSFEMELLDG